MGLRELILATASKGVKCPYARGTQGKLCVTCMFVFGDQGFVSITVAI